MSEKTPEQELEELEAAREARRAKAKAEREAATKRQALADAKALADAEEKHGDSYVYGEEKPEGRRIAMVKTDLGTVILKRPDALVQKRFRANITKGGSVAEEAQNLYVRACLVHPPRDQLNTMLDEQADIVERLVMACAQLAGHRSEEVLGK